QSREAVALSLYSREEHSDAAERSIGRHDPGHARHAHPESAQPRADARLGRHRAHSPVVERVARRQPRVALSGALSPQASGLDRLRMANHREQSARALLLAHRRRSSSARRRAARLGAPLARHRARPRHGAAMKRGNWWTRLVAELRRITGIFSSQREDRAMREEIRFHIDMHAAKLRGEGLSDAEARRRAAIAFGGASQWSEAARDEYRSRPIEEALRDTRFVVRSLRRAPIFTATVLLTLATGIGAAAAIFTVVNDVVVRPLPYGNPNELVYLSHDSPALSFYDAGFTPGMYFTYRRLAHSLQGIALFQTGSMNVTDPNGTGEPQRLTSAFVSGNFMSLFQVPAALGRALTDADDRPGAPKVIVISDGLWRARFGGSPSAIGKRLIAAGGVREIVGVMPPAFRVPDANTQVWSPLQLDPAAAWLGGFNSKAYARLAPNVSIAQATRDLTATLPRAADLFPLIAPGVTAKLLFEQGKPVPTVAPLRDHVVAGIAATLWTIGAAAALVLLVMCANVANLMLVRAEGRRRELGIRIAIGAGRGRVVSYFLIESVLLAAVASALALAAAIGAVHLLVHSSPIEIPRIAEVQVDWTTIAFIVVTSLG